MEALQQELLGLGMDKIVLSSVFMYFVKTGLISDLEEPHST